ncbi:unnamed protein product [Darwinula stevensoni]|uniref:Cyclase n=1 Tax=Darwinula stevensoni TaxID=69355 RepID=A0A7R8X4K2_9CRUS|nr:unnamed protein product [Darwinula stevensoni]CAG0879090.1 unnamed protein product [Darwinula stevensoni]
MLSAFHVLVFLCAAGHWVKGHHAPTSPLELEGEWVDLTHYLDDETLSWPGSLPFKLEVSVTGVQRNGYWVESFEFCSAEHIGTHVDAPVHFAEGANTVEQIPLENLIAPGVVIDVSKKVEAGNKDYGVTREDLEAWERVNGQLPKGAVVIMQSDWSRRWPDRQAYYGSNTPLDNKTFHFPGWSPEAATWLVEERAVAGVGVDTASVDRGQETSFKTHTILAPKNIYGIENLNNLHRLPPRGFLVLVAPLKLVGGSGGPARIFAFIPHKGSKGGSSRFPVHADHSDDDDDDDGGGEKAGKSFPSVSLLKAAPGDWLDLSHGLSESMPLWPTTRSFNVSVIHRGRTPEGYWLEHSNLCMGEHSGTHMDSPAHFAEGKWRTNEIPMNHLLAVPGVKLDFRDEAKVLDWELKKKDVQEWESREGKIPIGSLVLLQTGWEAFWNDRKKYFGLPDSFPSQKRPAPDDVDEFHFPGFSPEATEFLVLERKVVGLGTDAVSIDRGQSKDKGAHRILNGNNSYGLENLKNLDKVPTRDFTAFVLPLNIRGGSGSPSTLSFLRVRMSENVMSPLFRLLVSLCAVGRGIRCSSPLEAEGEWVDLTHDLEEATLVWPSTQPFKLDLAYTGFQKNGVWIEGFDFCASEHTGTHVDAPSQFFMGGTTVGQLPLKSLIAPGVVIDVSRKVETGNKDYAVTREDVEEWEREHGPLPKGAILIMHSKWGQKWPDLTAYFGSSTPLNNKTFHFPGWSLEAADWLKKNRAIAAIGVDTMSVDVGQDTSFKTHANLYSANIYGIENLANVHRLPPKGFLVLVAPLKLVNGSGGPARVFAFVPHQDSKASSRSVGSDEKGKTKTTLTSVSFLKVPPEDWVDLSHGLSEAMPLWPSSRPLNFSVIHRGRTPEGYWLEYSNFCVAEHSGTHMDSPSHFAEGKWKTHEIPINHLLAVPGVKLDFREEARRNPDWELKKKDVEEWEKKEGRIPTGSLVLLQTGWEAFWNDPKEFFGLPNSFPSKKRPTTEDASQFHFPGFSPEATEFLVRERKVVGLGIDTASIDRGQTKDYKTHRILNGNNSYGLENLRNLDLIPVKDFTVFVLPLKIRGGTGTPVRNCLESSWIGVPPQANELMKFDALKLSVGRDLVA